MIANVDIYFIYTVKTLPFLAYNFKEKILSHFHGPSHTIIKQISIQHATCIANIHYFIPEKIHQNYFRLPQSSNLQF